MAISKTDRQIEMIELLNRKVIFLPGSYDKRFCQSMAYGSDLTEKQAAYLEKVFHRYRRRIKDHERLCSFCEEQAAVQLVLEL